MAESAESAKTENSEDVKSKEHEDIIRRAVERFKFADEATFDMREAGRDDIRFRAGDQWPEEFKKVRANDNRPCLTINRMPGLVRQVTNDQRQNRPSIKISPADDAADIETAKVYNGIVRNIQYNSNAETAYDTAFENAANRSYGYFRVVTAYESPTSFNQELQIKRIQDPDSVRLDPHHKEPDGSDANWGHVVEEISSDDFKQQYPNAELTHASDWGDLSKRYPGWFTDKSARVCEYYERVFEEIEIALMADGSVVKKSDLMAGMNPVDTRKARVPKVMHYKLTACDVLEESEFPAPWIPIIPVYGDEVVVDGKVIFESVIRHAKDPQRMYNLWKSSETETVALAPRVPWVGVEGQFEGHEHKWATANQKNHAFLEYKPVSIGGQPVGPPQRQVFEPPIQAITQAGMLAADDMKATTGIYDAAVGARSNETSGRAIQGRVAQAQTSNFHFMDNMKRSMRHCGRIVVDAIPRVYDTARAVRILGEEGEAEVVWVNKVFERNGQEAFYDLSVGKYDVIIETGPTYASKRQEAKIEMTELARANPKILDVAGDLIVKNMDFAGSSEISERLKKTLPPGISEDKGKKPLPPEAQAQMQQMQQMIEVLTGKLNEANDAISTKRIEIESKERIAMQELQVKLAIESAKIDAADALALFRAEIQQLEGRMNLLGQHEPIEEVQPGAGPEGAAMPEQQPQPTGGIPPGNNMGV